MCVFSVQGITVDSRVAAGAPRRTYNNDGPAFHDPAEFDDYADEDADVDDGHEEDL